MSNVEKYIHELERSSGFYSKMISDRESKAFEYGTLVVRNSILISGGALLAIPTIASLASEVNVNLLSAKVAALSLAGSLITALLGAYVVHINWALHISLWVKFQEAHREFLKRRYLDGDESAIYDNSSAKGSVFWVNFTFWLPHVLAVLYLLLLSYGLYRLYDAFGLA